MNGLDEIEVNIGKAKDLLEYLQNQHYIIDATKEKHEIIQIDNYYLREIYHDTSLFLDVIVDYMINIQNDIITYSKKKSYYLKMEVINMSRGKVL